MFRLSDITIYILFLRIIGKIISLSSSPLPLPPPPLPPLPPPPPSNCRTCRGAGGSIDRPSLATRLYYDFTLLYIEACTYTR